MSARLLPGALVAEKYRILERLGAGGMGEVYRAKNELAGRMVALKLLREAFAEDHELTKRFFQEAQAANRVQHPNIVDVLDAGFSKQGPYVAMECLEGASVGAILASAGKVDTATCAAILIPTLEALDAAHKEGIVHRDLKPENLFVCRLQREVRVKLLDFGIAKVLSGSSASPRTHTGIIFGTPDYLSPEQASGEGAVDGRSDIFALAVVMFELLTGKRPFESPSAVATAYKIVHAPAPRLADMAGAENDPRAQAALDRALAKAKEDRYETAGDFAAALSAIVPDLKLREQKLRATLDALEALAPRKEIDSADEAPRAAPAVAKDDPRREAPTPGEEDASPAHAVASIALAETARAPAGPTLISANFSSNRPTPGPAASPAPPAFTPRAPSVKTSLSSGPLSARAMRGSQPEIRLSDRDRPMSLAEPRGPAYTPSRERVYTPRSLPAHVRGKCHTRGSLPRAVDRWIERSRGSEARAKILSMLPNDLADTFRADGFNALVWYDLVAVDSYLEVSTPHVLGGDVSSWRTLAAEHYERDLGPLLRPSSARASEPPAALRRFPIAWSRLFDFGTVKILDETRSSALVRVDGFEAASLALRYVVIGTLEGLLKSLGLANVKARVLVGEASFARDFEYDVAW